MRCRLSQACATFTHASPSPHHHHRTPTSTQLHHNSLTGTIPDALGFGFLVRTNFFINDNRLCGTLPAGVNVLSILGSVMGGGGFDVGNNFLAPYGQVATPCSQTSALADLYSSTVTVSGQDWASNRVVTGGLSGQVGTERRAADRMEEHGLHRPHRPYPNPCTHSNRALTHLCTHSHPTYPPPTNKPPPPRRTG